VCRKDNQGVETKSFTGAKPDRGLSVEQEARAGEAGFGFLQFGDVERGHLEAAGFKEGAGFREGGGKDNGSGASEGVGGVGLSGIDVDKIVGGKWSGIEPAAIGQQGVAAEIGDGGFQMQAAGYGNGDNLVSVRSDDLDELVDAFGVAAARQTDEEFAVDAENVPAFDGAGKLNVCQLAERRKRLRERGGFGAARSGAKREDDGEFVEDDGGIFNEHGIGQRRLGGKREYANPELFKELFVGVMLLPGFVHIDELAIDKAQLAIGKSRADGAGDGGEHDGQKVYTRKS
jgi:hypothetical protein